ncbi:gliding motility lipoprotein GldB [Mucilaginibacter sp. Bleaf8]|uniref:gliding motility lipoprotein GldB n=1 Tax=Mucilaginibacter sp. Bleaf8 TaxID=2834430 RepID=UPI001BCA7416|nr:gliding motility lipoprotein GldB [Mucilaginibacter sp. Bleaf8]MBS7564308.1 gliding motility lipoprotein GldB [Mucilaginibacter sp. Bleaf8]
MMMSSKSKVKHFYLYFLAVALLTACQRNKKVDVSNINLQVHIERFDDDFDKLRTPPIHPKAQLLYNRYASFYVDFMERILQAGAVTDTAASYGNLRRVFAGKPYNDLKQEVDLVFPNLEKQEAELTDAFKHIKYYYPQKQLPKVYAYVSGFQAQTSIGNDYFAVGLDLFLGAGNKFYPALINTFPHYISRRFTPDNITPRVVEGIAREDMFREREKDKSLLAKMVYEGKIMYFMDQVLPDAPDTLKIGYTGKQLEWCQHFEKNVWGYFLEENLLYETDYQKIQKYLNEAPFTPGLGENNESAPKLAIWTGWQIVRTYMQNHTNVTLQQLMNMNDAQQLLNESGYHPK